MWAGARHGLARPGADAQCDLAGVSASEIEGEPGLWVERLGDSLVVHWLTADSAPGVLEVPGSAH